MGFVAPIVCVFYLLVVSADAINDDVDAGDAFTGHFFDLLGNALLDFCSDSG